MAGKVREFRSLIYKHYDSESELANSMGWSKQRLNKMTNGKKEPNIKELTELSGRLHTSIGELANIFLSHKSPIRQPSSKSQSNQSRIPHP